MPFAHDLLNGICIFDKPLYEWIEYRRNLQISAKKYGFTCCVVIVKEVSKFFRNVFFFLLVEGCIIAAASLTHGIILCFIWYMMKLAWFEFADERKGIHCLLVYACMKRALLNHVIILNWIKSCYYTFLEFPRYRIILSDIA